MNTETYSVTAEVAESYREDSIEADLFYREVCLRDGKFTYPELVHCKQRYGHDETAARAQLRRMTSVLRLQAIAGTSADRQASVKESETAAAVAEKELPKLASKIAELQAKSDAIERDARLSAKRCEEQGGAVAKLQEHCPEHIAGSVRAAVQSIKASLGREVSDAEIRINELQNCLTPSRYKSENAWLERLERSCREAVERFGNPIRRKLSQQWPAIRANMEAELRELEDNLTKLRPQLDAALAEARRPLSYYAN